MWSWRWRSRTAAAAVIVFLLGAGPGGEAAAPAKSFTLRGAVEAARRDNPYISLAAMRADYAKLAWERAVEMANLVPEPVMTYDMVMARYLYPFQAEVAYRLAERGKVAAERDIVFQTEVAYHQAVLTEALVATAADAVTVAWRRLEAAQAMSQVGMATLTDILEAQAQVAEAEAGFERAKSARETSLMVFRRLVNVPWDLAISFTDRLCFQEPGKIDLQECEGLAVAQRFEAYQAAYEVERKRKEHELAQEYYDPLSWPYTPDMARLALLEAELRERMGHDNLRFEVRARHAELASARARVLAAQSALAHAQERARVANLKRGAGMISELEATGVEFSLKQAASRYYQALCDYNVALAAFRHSWSDGSAVSLPGAGGGETGWR